MQNVLVINCGSSSLKYQLLDMVEEQLALHTRQLRESRFGPAAEPGLWGNTIDTLVRDGFSGPVHCSPNTARCSMSLGRPAACL